ncbi:MAG: PIN domain-containing protein, partial [Burkholderiaceae bacterium]
MPLPKPPTKPATLLDLSTAVQARAGRARKSAAAEGPHDVVPISAGTALRGAAALKPPGAAAAATAASAAAAGARDAADMADAGDVRDMRDIRDARDARDARGGRSGKTGKGAPQAALLSPAPGAASARGGGGAAAKAGQHPAAAAQTAGTAGAETVASRNGAARPAARPAPIRDARRLTEQPPKLFVLDTNVLMHDPSSLFRFAEHDVYLPMMTLEELDNNKKGMSEVARNARQVSRSLDALIAAAPDDIDQGLSLSLLGNRDATGRLFFQTQAIASMLPSSLPMGKADNQILGVVRAMQDQLPDRQVVLVSKDINMRIKARTMGLPAEDYFNDQVIEDTDLLYSGMLALPADFWEKHGKGVESWQQNGYTFYRITGPLVSSLLLNQFVYFEGEMPLVARVREITGRTAVLQTLRDYGHLKN